MTDLQKATAGAILEESSNVIYAAVGERTQNAVAESAEILELKSRLEIRKIICWFLIFTLGFSIVCCFGLIFLYLFNGHALSESFIKWLCGATVAQIAVFLGVFVRSVWKK